jgi:hypothetical protein
LRQYKGIYEPEEEAKMKGSKAFMRKTRVKVESVDARMMDLLFPANRERNFDIEATPEPSIAPEIHASLVKQIAALTGAEPSPDQLKTGIREYVAECAKKMASRIDDQLTEAKYRNISREVMHSGHVYGTGILKGPLVERRQRIRYVWENGAYQQKTEAFAAPFISHVPVWRWYPDMTVTELSDCRYVWEHHRLGRSGLAELATRKSFDGVSIRSYIDTNPDGAIKIMNYEHELRGLKDENSTTLVHNRSGQYDVLERTGWLTGELLQSCGVEIPAERLHEAFFSNIWILPDGQVIKAILSPIEGQQWPYHLYYLEKDETSIFGDGLPAIMRDDQKMLNAVARMILDNAAMTTIPQFEVFATAFPPGTDLVTMYPGKIWPRVGGDFSSPAIRSLNFDSNLEDLLPILNLFDANADETTAIPKFTYGDNPGNGAAATMGGLSMLMAQANIALKDMIVSFDEGVTKPFIEQLYRWNMKFSADNTIKGDYDVKARGASSLVAKEVRANTLAQFGAMLQPEERPFIKWDSLVRQKADASDLTDLIKTEQEAQQAMEDPMVQQQQQMAMMQAELNLAIMRSKVAEQEARANKINAETVAAKVEAIYAAMQAAGVAAQNPSIAPAGDSMLKSAGWADATPEQPGSGAELAQGGAEQMPQIPPSAVEGMHAGMQTQKIE